MPKKKGFTLVEMLVALTIFSIVAVSLHAVLRTGLNTYRAGKEWSEEAGEARAFFYFFSRDLKNALAYSKELPFSGKADEIRFMMLTRRGDRGFDELARVSYRYDRGKKLVIRTVVGKEVEFEQKNSKEEIAAHGVDAFQLRYAFKPEHPSDLYRWKDAWPWEDTLPRGIRVTLGQRTISVLLPLGELGDEEKL